MTTFAETDQFRHEFNRPCVGDDLGPLGSYAKEIDGLESLVADRAVVGEVSWSLQTGIRNETK